MQYLAVRAVKPAEFTGHAVSERAQSTEKTCGSHTGRDRQSCDGTIAWHSGKGALGGHDTEAAHDMACIWSSNVCIA